MSNQGITSVTVSHPECSMNIYELPDVKVIFSVVGKGSHSNYKFQPHLGATGKVTPKWSGLHGTMDVCRS